MLHEVLMISITLDIQADHLDGDPERYVGGHPFVLRALIQSGFCTTEGYLTHAGRTYFFGPPETRDQFFLESGLGSPKAVTLHAQFPKEDLRRPSMRLIVRDNKLRNLLREHGLLKGECSELTPKGQRALILRRMEVDDPNLLAKLHLKKSIEQYTSPDH